MLVHFEVENFRSFPDRQVFSMVASKATEHLDSHTFASDGVGIPRLLKVGVVYGPNAAGKTNLLRAVSFVQQFVLSSATSAGRQLPYAPFMLSSEDRDSEFEITFLQAGKRYVYGFALNSERVTKEFLTEFSSGEKRVGRRELFARTWDTADGRYQWKFSSFLSGPKSTWSEATRPDSLFLSTAVQLNSTQLLEVFDWFKKKLVVIVGDTQMNRALTLNLLQTAEGRGKVLPFLKEADLGISDVHIEREPIPEGGMNVKGNRILLHNVDDANPKPQVLTVKFSHANSDESKAITLPLEEESSGTQILFDTAGAWLNVLDNGEVLLFDEIDTNIHPSLLRFLVGKFNSPKTNPHNAQLICTTHNTTLLNRKLLRRDQVWFVEKDSDGGSHVYPLTDFSPRGDEDLESWYMRGKYGAQPVLVEG